MSDLNLDETQMKRFLLGDLGEEERDRVEERSVVDQDYADALGALEDELILAHLHKELPAEVDAQFRAAMLSTPAQRRRVDEMRALVAAAEAAARPWWHWSPRGFVLITATATAVLVLTIGLMVRRERPSNAEESQAASAGVRSGAATPAPVATLFLTPTVRLADDKPGNVLRVPGGAQTVQLRMIVPAEPGSRITAQLRRADGALVPIDGAPVARETPQGLDLTWAIAASSIPPGQYDLALNAETAGRASENIANRSFTIEK